MTAWEPECDRLPTHNMEDITLIQQLIQQQPKHVWMLLKVNPHMSQEVRLKKRQAFFEMCDVIANQMMELSHRNAEKYLKLRAEIGKILKKHLDSI